MELWIARNCNNCLYMYDERPKQHNGFFSSSDWCIIYPIDDDLFPEVTFENSPKKVELKLIEEECKELL